MDDLISRAAAISALWKALYEYEDKTEKQFQETEDLDVGDWIVHRSFVQIMSDIDRQTILKLPSAQPERPEQPESAREYCAECDHIEMCRWYPYEGCEFRSLPPAQPERKKGKWIERESGIEDKENGFETVIVCSCCDFPATTFYSEDCESRTQIRTDFCPNCGADMRGEQNV